MVLLAGDEDRVLAGRVRHDLHGALRHPRIEVAERVARLVVMVVGVEDSEAHGPSLLLVDRTISYHLTADEAAVKRRDPNHQLEFLLVEVVRLQFRVYNGRFRATGLNQSQVTALIHLDRVEELSQTDLAARLGMRKAAPGTLIDGLEGKGLVERTRGREDRRLQLVSITDAGDASSMRSTTWARHSAWGSGRASRARSAPARLDPAAHPRETCARWRARGGDERGGAQMNSPCEPRVRSPD